MQQAFGAVEIERTMRDDGITIGHGVVRIGDSIVEVAEASEQWVATRSALHLYVADIWGNHWYISRFNG